MKQYLSVVDRILKEGTWKPSARQGMPRTIGVSNSTIQHDMKKGFPLLTSKFMGWEGVVVELLWFLKGDTNIKYLVGHGCNIWNKDAHKWYLKKLAESTDGAIEPMSIEKFVKTIKDTAPEELTNWFTGYTLGDLGKVYGYQWRNFGGQTDQIKNLINGLKTNPFSRYHIISAWNPNDINEMALPPCHSFYQFVVRSIPLDVLQYNLIQLGEDIRQSECLERSKVLGLPIYYLDLNMYQRSCDTMLGVPYNIASMGALMTIIGNCVDMIPGELTWTGGDTHIYENHVDNAKVQLERTLYSLPKLLLSKNIQCLGDIENLSISDFELVDYVSGDKIDFELSVGV